MLGAIAGDIIGSVYENLPTKRKDFRLFLETPSSARERDIFVPDKDGEAGDIECIVDGAGRSQAEKGPLEARSSFQTEPRFTPVSKFTDDTVLTVAVADALMNDRDYSKAIKTYARKHPLRGYGPRFLKWMALPGSKPYNSLGNGSAMRVSPVAWACQSEEEVLLEAERSAACTHNHTEGIKGAQAVALAIWLARHTQDKELIRCNVAERFGYDLSDTIDHIRPNYKPDITCPGSVPQAIIAFLDSTDFEDAIRNAVSLGGDADTQACIAGSIAEAFYGEIPEEILQKIQKKLSPDLWETTQRFCQRYDIRSS